MNDGDTRIGLRGLYDATGTTICLHVDGCRMLQAVNRKRGMHPVDPTTEEDLQDWAERGFKVTVCRCARAT